MTLSPRARAFFACLPAFLFGAYPLSVIVSVNGNVLPLEPGIIARFLIFVLCMVTLLLLTLRLVIRDFIARSLWLSWFMLAFGCYGFVVGALENAGAGVARTSTWFAIAYILLSIVIVTIAVRPWVVRPRNLVTANLVAIVMVSVNVWTGLSGTLEGRQAPWHGIADASIASTLSQAATPQAAPNRNIYYIVLDGFGRADVLRDMYAVDLSGFVGSLEEKGFYVAERAQSNYAQTFLSFASMLNMSYLDDVAASAGTGSGNRAPLQYLIGHNAVMRMARQAGYRVLGIGSDYVATLQLDGADMCVCQQFGLDSIELAALALTPIAAVPVNRWAFAAHRQKVLTSFDAIERAGTGGQPTFVFAHIVAPHPPFIFNEDGSPRAHDSAPFMFNDGDHYLGSRQDYVAGYHDQVQFIARRLTKLVATLLSRPGPEPVIILQGDHGPAALLHWEDAAATNMKERLSIFEAFHFPGTGTSLYPTITPVNGVRILANSYLGGDLPLLPDKSFFSTWNRFLTFIPVLPLPPPAR